MLALSLPLILPIDYQVSGGVVLKWRVCFAFRRPDAVCRNCTQNSSTLSKRFKIHHTQCWVCVFDVVVCFSVYRGLFEFICTELRHYNNHDILLSNLSGNSHIITANSTHSQQQQQQNAHTLNTKCAVSYLLIIPWFLLARLGANTWDNGKIAIYFFFFLHHVWFDLKVHLVCVCQSCDRFDCQC